MKFAEILLIANCFAALVEVQGQQAQLNGIKEILKRMGSECVSKTSGGDAPEELAHITRVIDKCFKSLNYLRFESKFDEQMEASNMQRTEANLQRLVYKVGCEMTIQTTDCLENFETKLKDCRHVSGLAMFSLFRTTCRNDGNILNEFSKCEVDIPAFRTCLVGITPQNVSDTEREAYVRNNACKVSTHVKDCVANGFGTCNNGKYKQDVDEFLVDLKAESPEAAECFFQ